jgi:excisionase family DNA binding protein
MSLPNICALTHTRPAEGEFFSLFIELPGRELCCGAHGLNGAQWCSVVLKWGIGKGVVAFIAFIRHLPSMARASRSSFDTALSAVQPAPSAAEQACAAQLVELVGHSPTAGRHIVVKVDGRDVELPASLAEVIVRAAELLAEGHSVTVLADEAMLTTQAAADVLNVSRQYLVQLVDDRRLPAVMVGSHRRLRAADVQAFKAVRDRERSAALDRLVALSKDAGGYEA